MKRSATVLILLSMLLALALSLSGCGGDDDKDDSRHYKVGVVNLTPVLEPVLQGFRAELVARGYTEGDNLTIYYDGPVGSIDGLDAAVQALLDQDVDLILAMSTSAAQAAQRVTQDVPIVFVPVGDPVGAGLVDNLRAPGGNLTGITFGNQEGPRLDWLQKIAPDVKTIFVPYNPEDDSAVMALADVSEAAEKLGIEINADTCTDTAELDQVLHDMPEDVDAIFMLPDPIVATNIDMLLVVARERKLPLAAPTSTLVQAGALFSYGLELSEVGTQAARLVDGVLKGKTAGDLPVEMAEYYLSINLVTAEAIGLEFTDEVINRARLIVRATE